MESKLYSQAASPSAGQFTALGIYLLICLRVVVGAMIEFAVLMYKKRKSEHTVLGEMANLEKDLINLKSWNRNVQAWNEAIVVGNISESVLNFDKQEARLDETIIKERRKFLCESNKIDYIALFVFALLFLNFNVVYWAYYLLF